MNELAQMLSTQKEEHDKEIKQLKDGFAKKMAQWEVNLCVDENNVSENFY
jgi:hypothetical protein